MNVTAFAVRIPRRPGFNAPHGHTVKFTDKGEASRYLHRCCGDCKLVTIPAISR